LTTNIGLSLQAGIGPNISPADNLLISILTGAPAASALALGFQEPTNGTANPTTPADPTAVVAPIRKLRRPVLTLSSFKMNSPYRYNVHPLSHTRLDQPQDQGG
jgi:hypothetical protein